MLLFIDLPYGLAKNIVAPSCFLDMLDKLQKRVCRTAGPKLAVTPIPLGNRKSAASLNPF